MTVYKSNIQDFRVVKDGTDGEDGVGIVSIVEYYAVSASSSIPPTIWETTVPEMTETNCYLWNYSITTYTKGDSTESDPRVIGTYSKNGEDGVGIASITEYYALSRSNTIIDGGSWQTEVPTMTAELKYLWSYEVISYTDGTDYSTSQRVIGVYGDNFTWNLAEGTSSDWESFTVVDQDNFTVYPFYFAEMNDGSVSAGDRLQLSLYLKFGDDFAATSTGTSTMYLQGTMNYGGTWTSISITGGRWDTELQDILNSDSREGYLTTYIDITSAMVDGTYSGKWTIGLRFNYYAGTVYGKCAMANIGSSPATWAPAVTEIYGNDGVGISNVVNYYLATNESSNVIIDTEGWTDTVQSVSEDAKYLWNYEVVVYTNGNYTTTDPCIIGSYGEDGRGIVSIVEYYALTQSISTPEDSAWQTEIPVMTSDWRYLWNYEAITYTDSDEPEITEAKIIGVYGDAGKDGADGTSVNILGTAYTTENEYSEGSLYTLYYDEDLSTPIENAEAGDAYLVNGYLFVYAELDEAFTCAGVIQGVGIESVVNYYLAADIATGITSENYSDYTWTTEPTGITESKKYLWNYEVIYYTDGSETMTPPCVIGAYGSDGRGIVSIVEYYALTQDTTEPSSDSWQTDVPTMTAEWKYLWNYEAITYTDSNIPETTDAKIIGVYGEDGSDGISITNVVNYYLATDQSSGIKITTSGWTTTVQSISEEKQYLWNYEVVEYSEGDSTITDPCIIGYFGTDGVGIVSIVEYYALSSDSETVPTEWQVGDSDNPPPSMDAINRYLWNYEEITYSDGTVDTGGKKIIGVYSVDGVGISSITEYYAVSSSSTTAPSTWSTSVQTMDSTNKYLWNYEIIEYTDGTSTYTSKRVIGTYSVDGADGVGISNITEYYAVSSSSSTAPTSWSTSVQTMTTTNKYLWNYEVITYTDNTTSSTSKRVIGVYGNTGAAGADGEDGTDGVGISSITNYYLRSSSSSGVTTSTSGWTTTIQTITTTYKYLWNYEVVAYTDGTSYTSTPCIIGVYGNTGATGADGIGISGITEYYAVSSSNSSAPTSWSTSVQTMTATNKYLWNYEVVSYTDGTTSSTDKRVIGVYGADGEDGEDGVGIKSITNYYLRSTSSSGITTSTSGWSTTVPTITTTYKYLWNYEVVAYTDGTSYTSTPCIIGVYGNTGATGADGVGISSIVNYYLVTSASSGVTTSTSGWTTTVQTVTTTKKYLWNYEVITYTEGDPYTSTPCIIGVYGDTGAAGADGVSMTSVTEYYAVSSSPSTAPTSWVEGSSGNIPSMTVTNRYLWNYEVVNYSDGTSTKGSAKVIGVYGNTGEAGEDGRSIQSIETQYYLSTSSTSQAGGSWVSYLPEWKEGYYIWSRSYIIWEDGGDYTYTTPVLMAGLNTISETVSTVSANFTVLEDNITSAVEGVTTTVNNLADTVTTIQNQYSEVIQTIDGISSEVGDITTVLNGDGEEVGLVSQVSTLTQTADSIALNVSSVQNQLDNLTIGARNYLLNTQTLEAKNLVTVLSSAFVYSTDENGYGVWTVTGTGEYLSLSMATSIDASDDVLADKELVISADIKCDDIIEYPSHYQFTFAIFGYNDNASSWTRVYYKGSSFSVTTFAYNTDDFVDDEWFRIKGKFTGYARTDLNQSTTTIYDNYLYVIQFFSNSNNSTGGTISIRKPKLEIGNVATDWTPAPEDAETYTDEAIEASLVLYLDDDGVAHLTANADSIELSAGQLIINSGNFTLDANGTMTCINGYFSGTIIADRGTIGGWYITETRIQTSETIDIEEAEAGMLLINEVDEPYICVQDVTGHPTFQITRDGDIRLDSTVYMYDPNYDYWMDKYGLSNYYPQWIKAFTFTSYLEEFGSEYEDDEDDEEVVEEDDLWMLTIGFLNETVYIPGGIRCVNSITGDEVICTNLLVKSSASGGSGEADFDVVTYFNEATYFTHGYVNCSTVIVLDNNVGIYSVDTDGANKQMAVLNGNNYYVLGGGTVANRVYLGTTEYTTNIYLRCSSTVYSGPKQIPLREVQKGTVSITPSGANTPTSKTVSFSYTFSEVPAVVTTPVTEYPGTSVTGWSTTARSTTSFVAWVTRTSTTSTTLSWVAVY